MDIGNGIAVDRSVGAGGDNVAVLRDVHYAVDGKPVFAGLDVEIARGQVTAIMGPSGTGKTTLLRLITGQVRADSGSVVVEGREVSTLSRRELYALRRRMGMLFQNGALLTDLDVFENVAFPLREHARLPERLVRSLVLAKLHAVGLRGAAWLMPQQLSGGMSRRVALARAIVFDPMLILYDEPFVGLDPIALNQVLRLIRTLNRELGITSVLVAHEFAAVREVADQVYLIAGGKCVAGGSPQQLAQGDSPWTAQFFGGALDGPVPFQYPAQPLARDFGFGEGVA